MNKRKIGILTFVFLCSISSVAYGSYVIFDEENTKKDTVIDPIDLSVNELPFQTISFSNVVNKILTKNNSILSDIYQVEMKFNNLFYNDIYNFDTSQTNDGGLLIDVSIPSTNLYGHIVNNVNYNFIEFQYNNYYLENDLGFSFQYIDSNINKSCYTFADNKVSLVIPFSETRSTFKNYYLYKIAVDNNIPYTDEEWNFKINFNFSIVNEKLGCSDEFYLTDFQNIKISIRGLSFA